MDNLGGFDPSTMTYLASQMAHPNAGVTGDPFQEMMLPLDLPDHHSAYGYAGYGQKKRGMRMADGVLTRFIGATI